MKNESTDVVLNIYMLKPNKQTGKLFCNFFVHSVHSYSRSYVYRYMLDYIPLWYVCLPNAFTKKPHPLRATIYNTNI